MIQYSKNTKILSERQTKPCTTTQKSKAKILPSRGHAGTREQVPDVDVGQQGQQQYGYEYCRHVGRCYADAKIVKAESSKTSLPDFTAGAHPARTRSAETGDMTRTAAGRDAYAIFFSRGGGRNVVRTLFLRIFGSTGQGAGIAAPEACAPALTRRHQRRSARPRRVRKTNKTYRR